jgi:hypothetical protein
MSEKKTLNNGIKGTRCLRVVNHGVYRKLDGRCKEAKEFKNLVGLLIERFPEPAPPVVQLLAQRAAFKLIRVTAFETYVLLGNTPSPDSERTYLTLAGQIRQDLETLWRMAKETGPADRVPSLQEYLEALKTGKVQVGECES